MRCQSRGFTGRAKFQQDLMVLGDRLFYFREMKNIRRPVLCVCNRFHNCSVGVPQPDRAALSNRRTSEFLFILLAKLKSSTVMPCPYSMFPGL
jgi:hypothetical protein